MDIKEFVTERITKNNLPLNANECLEIMKKYEEIYPDVSEIKLFFHLVLNKVGGILNKIDHDCAEMFGNLKVKGRGEITFYEFDFEDDYLEWQQLRLEVYKQLDDLGDIRLVNYVELSTMNVISDIFTKCKYELISDKNKVSIVNKTGYGTDQDTQSFIKFMGTKFKEGYSFKPFL
jgi:hypothetical protein